MEKKEKKGLRMPKIYFAVKPPEQSHEDFRREQARKMEEHGVATVSREEMKAAMAESDFNLDDIEVSDSPNVVSRLCKKVLKAFWG